MNHYTLFLFAKTYLAVLYLASNRQLTVVTLQLTGVILSGVQHHCGVFNLKSSILFCAAPVRRGAAWAARLKR